MKNKYYLTLKIIIKNLFFLLFFCKFSIANQINISADNIETIGDNLIKASQNIIIRDEKGITIFADDLEANNKKEIYIIENNVMEPNQREHNKHNLTELNITDGITHGKPTGNEPYSCEDPF